MDKKVRRVNQVGRPPLPDEDRLELEVTIKFNLRDFQMLKYNSRCSRMPLATWARSKLIETIIREYMINLARKNEIDVIASE